MSAQHTSGPWTIGSNGHNVSMVFAGDDAIASVFGLPLNTTTDDACLSSAKWRQGFANARLIAVAPELYETLNLVLPILRGIDGKCTGNTAMMARVEAILAKVTAS